MVRQRCLHPGLPAEWWAGALRSMNNTAFWPKREERKLQSARWPVLLLSLPPPLSHVPLHPLLPPSVNRKVQQAGQGPFPRGSISWTSLPTLSFSVWKQRLAERISFGMTTAWWHLSVLCSPPPTHTHTHSPAHFPYISPLIPVNVLPPWGHWPIPDYTNLHIHTQSKLTIPS